jgi:rhodanese-related sulfurtransferase
MKKIYTALFILLCAACQKASDRDLDPKAFQEKISSTGDAVVLDVRTPAEVDQGHIAGAVHFDILNDDFPKNIAGLEKDKTYFVYCGSGVRSSKAMDLMKSMGFKKLYGLNGGIKEWKDQGLEIVK